MHKSSKRYMTVTVTSSILSVQVGTLFRAPNAPLVWVFGFILNPRPKSYVALLNHKPASPTFSRPVHSTVRAPARLAYCGACSSAYRSSPWCPHSVAVTQVRALHGDTEGLTPVPIQARRFAHSQPQRGASSRHRGTLRGSYRSISIWPPHRRTSECPKRVAASQPRAFISQTVVLASPLQHVDAPSDGRLDARHLIPATSVLLRPPKLPDGVNTKSFR